MYYYKLLLSYDGTGYAGWQAQKNVPSIAQAITTMFRTVFSHDASIKGASRTDAGVHARGQVAIIRTELEITADALRTALNNRLPGGIVIHDVAIVDRYYDIFADVDYKIYHYNFFTERPSPFSHRYGWYVDYPLDFEKLNQALQLFVGTHDFRSFCSSEDTRENTIRTIYAITIERNESLQSYCIIVKGNAFLRHMIRRIVGACIEAAGRKDFTLERLQRTLDAKNSAQGLFNAPACGLTLHTIVYLTNKEIR